jgi:hypothetical protein
MHLNILPLQLSDVSSRFTLEIKFHLNMFALYMTIHEAVSCSCIEFKIHTARSSQPLVASSQPLVASSQLLVESSQLLIMHIPLEVAKPPTMCG